MLLVMIIAVLLPWTSAQTFCVELKMVHGIHIKISILHELKVRKSLDKRDNAYLPSDTVFFCTRIIRILWTASSCYDKCFCCQDLLLSTLICALEKKLWNLKQ